jgi:hypothetical protein
MFKNRKMGDLSNFERGQIVGVRLAGACVTKVGTLLGALRVTFFKVISAYTIHGKTTSAKRNSGQKLTLRRIVLKNHNYCNTGDSKTEYLS